MDGTFVARSKEKAGEAATDARVSAEFAVMFTDAVAAPRQPLMNTTTPTFL